jgi:hypothetical protein
VLSWRRPTRTGQVAHLALAIAALLVLVGANAPFPPVDAAAPLLVDAPTQGGGSGGILGGGIGLLLLAGLGIAILIAVAAAAVVLFRTRASKLPAGSDEGWWTCANCGAGNLDGAARCHACSTWRRATARTTGA